MAVGAFNHLALGALVDHLRQLEWVRPESVQLFAKEQKDDRFTAFEPARSSFGSILDAEYETLVVRRDRELVFRHCGPYGYRPVPVEGFGEVDWKDRARVRVIAVDHVAKQMTVEIVGLVQAQPGNEQDAE